MSEPAASLEARAAAFAAALRDGAEVWFQHDGLIYFRVPTGVVAAYAAARMRSLPGPAVMRAMMVAFAGEDLYLRYHEHEDWIFWRIAKAWAARLGDLERQVRGLPHQGIAA